MDYLFIMDEKHKCHGVTKDNISSNISQNKQKQASPSLVS